MKLFAATALCLSLALAGCGESTSTSGDATLQDIASAPNRVEANISGMDCTGCSGSVCNMAEGIAGVTGAHADPGTGEVILALSEDADHDAVVAAFEEQVVAMSGGEKYTVNTINTVTAEEATEEPAEEEAAPAEEAVEEAAEEAADAGDAAEGEVVFTGTRVQANISGMDCSGCSGSVVATCQQIQGVANATADHESGDVVLALEDEADAQAVIAAFQAQVTAMAGGEKYTVNTIAAADTE